MNVPHLHLILNHVPTIGTAVALGLLLLSLLRRNQQLTRVAFEVFCVVALIVMMVDVGLALTLRASAHAL